MGDSVKRLMMGGSEGLSNGFYVARLVSLLAPRYWGKKGRIGFQEDFFQINLAKDNLEPLVISNVSVNAEIKVEMIDGINAFFPGSITMENTRWLLIGKILDYLDGFGKGFSGVDD